MINNHRNNDDRGQVGIGTLIVFIAMVLVAAIAAGVLINTAGFLQTQAEATGEESTKQVSDQVQAVNEVGFTGAVDDADFATTEIANLGPGNDEIHRIELTVQKSPGADAIDLDKATIEYLGDSAETLTHVDAYDGSADDLESGAGLTADQSGFFTTTEVRGTSGNSVLIADDDRTAIIIPLGTYDQAADGHGWVATDDTVTQPGFLQEGDDVSLTITTAQGTQTVVSLNAPNIINDEPAVKL